MIRGAVFAGLLGLALGLAPRGGVAQQQTGAEAAMQALRAAATALEAAEGAHDRISALTETVRAYEAGLAALREGLRQATLQERAIADVFATESDRLAKLLGVLQAIQRAPETSLLLHPEGPVGTARTGMILADVTPALAREAADLRRQLEEVATLRAVQEAAVAALEEGLQGVQRARTELSLAVANRTDLPRRLVTDPEAMENLLTSADTLESFAGGLLSTAAVDSSVPVADSDIASAMGALDLPVAGQVIRRAGEADAAGVRRPGWLVATAPRALVTTPWPATIRYLGPLLDYGQVAVLEPGEGYFLVLAGLGEVYGEIGEVLPKGAPVGLMGGEAATTDQGFLIAGTQGGGVDPTETLYIELRRNGEPLDPGDWFKAD